MQVDVSADQLLDVRGEPITLTAQQKRFLSCDAPFVALLGGFGSGKSFSGCIKAALTALWHGSGYTGLIVAPTYSMLQRTVFPTLRTILRQLGDPENGRSLWDLSSYSPSKQELTLPNGHVIYMASADKPERIRGTKLGCVWVDECQAVKNFPELWISGTSRLRKARDDRTQFICTGTPERKDEVYRKWCEGPDEDEPEARALWKERFRLFRASTRDNPSIPQETIENILATFPPQVIPAYLDGQHIEESLGLCYYNFRKSANANLAAVYDRQLPLHISWDFNVDPMVCTIYQVRAGLLMSIDEIGLRNANTPSVCQEFIRRYGRQGENHTKDIHVYGDASDKVGLSNYDEIEDYLRTHFPGNLYRRVPSANARHQRRLVAVNARFRNARGDVGYWINPKTCKGLLRDIENQAMEGQSKNKKQVMEDGTMLGHYSDTLDYIIDVLFPFRRRASGEYGQKSKMTEHLP